MSHQRKYAATIKKSKAGNVLAQRGATLGVWEGEVWGEAYTG